MPKHDGRPVFLNLARIHLPVMAVLSLGHRASGVLLVAVTPLALYLLERSLANEEGYAAVGALLAARGPRVVLVFLTWIFAHHFLAGIRYLLIDLGVGEDLRGGRTGAWLVIGGGIAALLAAAAVLL